MGSKSSSAPAPDPRLVDAQIRSMGIQEDAIGRIVSNSERLLPYQEQSLKFGLDTAKSAYDQSQQDREWMLTRRDKLAGIQDSLVQDANEYDTEANIDRMQGEAATDVDMAFDGARGQMNRGLGRMGVSPGSGRSLALNTQSAIAQASARAAAMTKVRQAARAEGLALKDRAHNALAGYPSMASSMTGAGAGFGASGLGLANAGLAGMNSGFGAAGGMAGQMGGNAAGMYGAQANYKLGQDRLASENNPLQTIIGAATGIGTGWALNKFGG